jgi:hypothetical protein
VQVHSISEDDTDPHTVAHTPNSHATSFAPTPMRRNPTPDSPLTPQLHSPSQSRGHQHGLHSVDAAVTADAQYRRQEEEEEELLRMPLLQQRSPMHALHTHGTPPGLHERTAPLVRLRMMPQAIAALAFTARTIINSSRRYLLGMRRRIAAGWLYTARRAPLLRDLPPAFSCSWPRHGAHSPIPTAQSLQPVCIVCAAVPGRRPEAIISDAHSFDAAVRHGLH